MTEKKQQVVSLQRGKLGRPRELQRPPGHFVFSFRLELQFNIVSFEAKNIQNWNASPSSAVRCTRRGSRPPRSPPAVLWLLFSQQGGLGEMTGSGGLAFAAGVQRFQTNLFHRAGNRHASARLKTHTGWKRSTLCHLLEASA